MNKVQYGSGGRPFTGWTNIDSSHPSANVRCNLTTRHPFPDNHFDFAFAEDFLEHLSQDESLRFFTEAFRTMKKGGVLRLSFPGLEGVLKRHYASNDLATAELASVDAYSRWGHLHFYSEQELSLVVKHLGFSKIEFVEYGKSQYPELCNLDWRSEQIGLNIYAEITKAAPEPGERK
jgi:predicted SAM-dependent methyltransferase